MFHGKRLEMRRLPALAGAGGRRGVFFYRDVGVGFVEAEGENVPPWLGGGN
jgi:hypothetical protein